MNHEIAILREACIRVTQMLAGMGIQVTQRGTRAYVETDSRTLKPKRVNIPYIPDNATESLILAIQGFIDHEVAHILFTNWEVVLKATKQGKHIHSLHNIVEDTFIERKIAGKFPGSTFNLDKLHRFFIEHITKAALAKPEVAGNPDNEFAVLIVPMARAWAGQKIFDDFLREEGHWDRMKPFTDKIGDLAKRFPTIASSEEAYDLAIAINKALTAKPKKEAPKAPPPPPSKDDEEGGEGEGEGAGTKPEDADESATSSAGDEVGDEEGDTKTPDGEEEGDGKGDHDPDEGEDAGGKAAGDDEPEGDDDDDGSEADDPREGADSDDGSDVSADPDDASGGDDGDRDERPGRSAESGGDEDEELAGGGVGVDDEDDADGEQVGSPDDGDEGKGEGARGRDEGGPREVDDRVEGEAMHGEDDHEEPGDWTSRVDAEALEAADFDGSAAELIGAEAREVTHAADYRIWTKDFDKIEPFPVDKAKWRDEWMTTLEDTTRHMVGVMQKDIERMMAARSQVVNVPGYRSGRLHGASLHRLKTGDTRVFRRRQENRSKDVVVGLLIDNSGSMWRGKIGVAMAAAYALSTTLERVGIRHEVLGFTTVHFGFHGLPREISKSVREEERRIGRMFSRYEPLYIPIFKGFDERLTPQVRQRFAAGQKGGHLANNVDGESVETAVWRLLGQKAERRVLMVLSDGQPAAEGSHREQVAHLKKTVRWASQVGVETIGIGIMSDAPKYYYPKHAVLHDLDSLPTTVMGEVKRILS